MTEPSAGYHGVRFYETFGDFGYSMRARLEQLRVLGSTLSPFNSFLLLQGIETLPVRMDRHCDNALAVARYLAEHPLVEWVRYPGLQRSTTSWRASTCQGCSAILSFGIRGGQAAGARSSERAVPESPGQCR